MTTLTLELTDEQFRHLADAARQQNLTIEELALRRLFPVHDDDEGFLELARSVIDEDRELLQRLA